MAANRRSVTVDGKTGKVIPAPSRAAPIKLDRLRAIRDEMGRLYRQSRAGRLDPSDLTKYVFALRQMGDMTAEIENREQFAARLAAIEAGAVSATVSTVLESENGNPIEIDNPT